jgi:hypothetical protein
MSDNSALQCIAVVLPRVRVHFNLGSEIAGLLSASMMAGVSDHRYALKRCCVIPSLIRR